MPKKENNQKPTPPKHILESIQGQKQLMPVSTIIDPILRKPVVLKVCGIGKSKLHELISSNKFPKPVVLGPPGSRAVGWKTSQVAGWINSRPQVQEVGA